MIIRRCLVCDQIIGYKNYLCTSCSEKLENSKLDITFVLCKKCGYPILDPVYNCPVCDSRRGNYIISLYSYKDIFARQILENYKFNYNKEYSHVFATILEKYAKNYDVIVPVPSSEHSLKKRGWDQMKTITEKLHSSNVSCLLVNSSECEQKQLNRIQRITLEDRFTVMDNNLDLDSKVLVVDDVTTTGSTIVSCIEKLKSYGFKNVSGFTFFVEQ